MLRHVFVEPPMCHRHVRLCKLTCKALSILHACVMRRRRRRRKEGMGKDPASFDSKAVIGSGASVTIVLLLFSKYSLKMETIDPVFLDRFEFGQSGQAKADLLYQRPPDMYAPSSRSLLSSLSRRLSLGTSWLEVAGSSMRGARGAYSSSLWSLYSSRSRRS